jgi:hypothetical protein
MKRSDEYVFRVALCGAAFLLLLANATTPPDGVVQGNTNKAISVSAGLNFEGLGQGEYGFSPDAAPPDTNASVGSTQVVEWVNESFAVFDKATGALTYGPAAGNTMWSGFGGGCATNNDGDPIVHFDRIAQRWDLYAIFRGHNAISAMRGGFNDRRCHRKLPSLLFPDAQLS